MSDFRQKLDRPMWIGGGTWPARTHLYQVASLTGITSRTSLSRINLSTPPLLEPFRNEIGDSIFAGKWMRT